MVIVILGMLVVIVPKHGMTSSSTMISHDACSRTKTGFGRRHDVLSRIYFQMMGYCFVRNGCTIPNQFHGQDCMDDLDQTL